jgi:copper(I)-binding protein
MCWSRRSLAPLLVTLTVAAACSPAEPEARTFGAAEITRGKVFYDTNGCAACHGRDGHGDGQLAPTLTPLPRDFRGADAFKGPRTIPAVSSIIARGLSAVPTPMPAFGHLDLETRELIAAYVLSLVDVDGASASTSQQRSASPLAAEHAWARQPAPSRDVTAVYVTLINTTAEPQRIVSGISSLARTVELHEMAMEGSMMRMRRIKEIAVPPQGRVELKPGGLHVMLFGLRQPLKVGDRLPVTLTLSSGATVSVDAEVRAAEGQQ